MNKIESRTIVQHLGRGLFTTIETKPHNHSTMKSELIDKIIQYANRRKENFINPDQFCNGAKHAYQDIIFLLEDLQADPEFPIDEIINQK